MKRPASGIMTVEGTYFDFDNPAASSITIYSIAHALGNCCRYAGHVREFYSVAQHSVLVSQHVPKEQALAALLHDASEAFIHDISRPLKHRLPEYRAFEWKIQACIYASFGLSIREATPEIHYADNSLLWTEIRDLMPPIDAMEGSVRGIPLPFTIIPLPPKEARQLFLDRYFALEASV